MSRLRQAVADSLLSFEAAGADAITARFAFPPEHLAFEGHFPAQKVLPAICQIMCILIMLERYKKQRVILKEVMLAKFVSPVLPGDEITCHCRIRQTPESADDFVAAVSITTVSGRISELKLRCAYVNPS